MFLTFQTIHNPHLITFINQMKRKTYTVTEEFESGQHYYEIAYCPSLKIDKQIRFSKIEHYLQFLDVLHEAGYTFTDEYQ